MINGLDVENMLGALCSGSPHRMLQAPTWGKCAFSGVSYRRYQRVLRSPKGFILMAALEPLSCRVGDMEDGGAVLGHLCSTFSIEQLNKWLHEFDDVRVTIWSRTGSRGVYWMNRGKIYKETDRVLYPCLLSSIRVWTRKAVYMTRDRDEFGTAWMARQR